MAADPRSYIRGILLGVVATLDDNATPADILVIWVGGPEDFKRLFLINGYDAVISIGRVSENQNPTNRHIQSVPLRYEGEVAVSTTAIDKTNLTATKLLNKIRLSIITVIEAAAKGNLVTISVRNDRGLTQPMGGYDPLWQDSFIISWKPLSSVGP